MNLRETIIIMDIISDVIFVILYTKNGRMEEWNNGIMEE
jgi:hypothetical protein